MKSLGSQGQKREFPDSVEVGTGCLLGETEGGEAIVTVG